jgi:O-antigen/teichoic acid export membrane protein
MTASENNKRIAKNTLFLYFRSFLTFVVGLYTSREVLGQLGVSDFGIYNVVGGVIVLFSFIQNAMYNATNRFFTFDLGKGDFEQLKKTFNLSIVIHIFTALVIFILGETIGLWFLNTQLNIPSGRMEAANFVYQFSIFAACIGILQIPYMVAINAHERMKVYAYMGIADSVLYLMIAISLGFAPIDKLKFYSILLFCLYIVRTIFYRAYCHKNFKETYFKWFWDKKMFLERLRFSSWTTLSGISAIVALQGINMLLNMFHGVVANAAYGIMTQITNGISQFTNNFFAAVNPQITKSYARGDIDYLHSLLFRSMKFSFLLSFAIAIPLVLNMDFILNVWLKIVPEYAVIFCQIRVIDWCLCMFFFSCYFPIMASGKIKFFLTVDSILTVQAFIFTYIFFKFDFSPVVVPIIYINVNIVRIVVIILISRNLIKFSIVELIYKVILKLSIVILISAPLPIFISFNTENWQAVLVTSISFLLLFLFSSISFGLDKNERAVVFNLVKKKFSIFYIRMFRRML